MLREQRIGDEVAFERFTQVRQCVGPESLHLQLGERLLNLRAFDLEHRHFRSERARFTGGGRQYPQIGDLERHQLEFHLRDAVAKARVFDERPAIGNLHGRYFFEFFQRAFAAADAGIVGALVRQQEFRVRPALVLVADQVPRRHVHVVEPNLVDLVLAVEHGDGL